MSKINGYLVVKSAKSDLYESYADDFILEIEGKLYEGFGRIPALDEDKLPPESKNIYLAALKVRGRSSLYPIIRNIEHAKTLCNELSSCEIIGIRSKHLDCDYDPMEDSNLDFKGIDVFCTGFMIKDKIFASKIIDESTFLFGEFEKKLNPSGLFDSAEDAWDFLYFYEKSQQGTGIEKIYLDEAEITEVYKKL